MADIPQSDPRRLLFDVDESLAGLDAAVAEIGPKLALRAVARLDQFARPGAEQLLTRYLSAGERDYLADSVWTALDTHAAHLVRCYRSFLNASIELATDDDKLRTARCAARALMTWALRKKLQRFRYRTPGAELWQEAHGLLQVLNRLGLPKTHVAPYRIDLAAALGPQRLAQGDSGGSSVRYCSVRKLRGAVLRLAAQVKKPNEAPAWLAQVPASSEQIESTVLILMNHWAHAPPTRSSERVSQTGELRVVLGFGLARRMIAAAHFARMGRSFEYEGEIVTRMFDEDRFGTVAPEDEVKKAAAIAAREPAAAKTPIEILRRLESGGDEAQMERWTQIDSSATGLGAVVPAVLPRHRIDLRIGQTVCRRRKCLELGGRWRQSWLVRPDHRQPGGARGRAACGDPCFQS
ncbi:MAG: hypothetical protein M0Z99_15405 [Betaproteobacteria bacterium]|nr:hypothetical protein [Betaproteobacteria bacterium]